jgi:hypothetical protein
MTASDETFVTLAVIGMLVMIGGVVFANVVVQQMRSVLNSSRSSGDQLKWHDAIQYVAQNVIDEYKSANPTGVLSRKLRIGYCLSAIGGVLMLGSVIAWQVFGTSK